MVFYVYFVKKLNQFFEYGKMTSCVVPGRGNDVMRGMTSWVEPSRGPGEGK